MRSGAGSVILIVALKELKDFFRDPRSIALSFLLPVILFPLLFLVLNIQSQSPESENRKYIIGIESDFPDNEWVVETEATTLVSLKNGNLSDWRKTFDALLVTHPQTGDPRILYDNSNSRSIAAYRIIEAVNTDASEIEDAKRSADEQNIELGYPLYSKEKGAGRIFLGIIIPFIFFVFSITCPLAVSADVSAGEKERRSIEPLLATSASRTGIIGGKLTAALIAGLCSLCAYLLGLFISSLLAPGILGEHTMDLSLHVSQISIITLLLLLLTALFTSIEICIGFLTRSVREAQLLSMPLLMIGMSAVYFSQAVDPVGRSAVLFHLPLINVALAVRETVHERISPAEIIWTFMWVLLYTAAFTALAVWTYQREFTVVKHR